MGPTGLRRTASEGGVGRRRTLSVIPMDSAHILLSCLGDPAAHPSFSTPFLPAASIGQPISTTEARERGLLPLADTVTPDLAWDVEWEGGDEAAEAEAELQAVLEDGKPPWVTCCLP